MESAALEAWSKGRPAANRRPAAMCLAPWVSLEFDPAGRVYACCANQLYPVGRIGEERLTDVWSGPRIQVLRDAMARWDSSVGCATCRWHIEHGRLDTDAAVYDRFEAIPGDRNWPSTMTFALSNRCNLACVMCSAELSSTIRHRAGLPPLTSPYDDEFFTDLELFLPGLEYAKFLGGEPFLSAEHHRVWDLMDRHRSPSRLQVTTNGTIWNDRVMWLMERFAVDVTVSVDGATAPTYESIRSGSDFHAVRTNIDRFAQACAEAGTELRLCFCLMPQNAHELNEVLTWGDQLGAPVSVNLVTDEGFSLHHLPPEQLEAVATHWSSLAPPRLNRSTWLVQVAQLDHVLAEQRSGTPTQPRRAVVPPPNTLGSALTDIRATCEPERVESERDRLAQWAEGGPVADLLVGEDGCITSLLAAHSDLGISPDIMGKPLDELVGAMESERHRRAWLLDETTHLTTVAVRTFVLSDEEPVRGAKGEIVRVVTMRTSTGFRVLLAQDLYYDRPRTTPPSTAVTLSRSVRR